MPTERAILEIVADVNKALGDFERFQKQWQGITRRMDAAADDVEFDRTSDSLKNLNRDAKKTFSQMTTAAKRAATGVKELARHSKTSANAQGELRDRTRELERQLARAEKRIRQFGTQGARATKKVKKEMSGLVATAGNLRSLFAGLSVLFLARAGFQALSSFTLRMAELQAVTGATAEEIVELRDVAISLGEKTIFSTTQAAEAMALLGRAGFETNEVIEALPGLLDLAAAGNLDLATATDIAANTLRAFNLEATEMARVADTIAAAAASANTSVQQLGEAMKFVAPIAANIGIPLNEVAAALGVMADRGLQASLGGTSLRATLAALIAPTNKTEKAILGLNLSLKEVDPTLRPLPEILRVLGDAGLGAADALAIAGKRGGQGLVVLTSAAEDVEKLSKALDEAGGTAADMAAIMQDTLSGATKKVISALDGLVQRTGNRGLGGSLKALLVLLAAVVQRLDGLFTFLQGTAALAFLPFALALEGITKGLLGLLTGLKAVAAFGGFKDLEAQLATAVRSVEDFSFVTEELRKGVNRSVSDIGRGFGLIVKGQTEAQKATEKSVQAQIAALREYQVEVGKAGSATAEQAKGIIDRVARIEAAINTLPIAQRQALQSISSDLALLREEYRETGEAIVEVSEEQAIALAKLEEATASFLERVAGGDFQAQIDAITEGVTQLTQEGRLTGEVQARIATEVAKIAAAAEKLGQTVPGLKELQEQFPEIEKGAKGAAKEVSTLADETERAASKAENLASGLKGAAAGIRALQDAQDRQGAAARGVADLAAEVESLRKQSVLSVEEQARLSVAELELADARQELTRATQEATATTKIFAPALDETAKRMKESRIEAIQLAVQLGLLSPATAALAFEAQLFGNELETTDGKVKDVSVSLGELTQESLDAQTVLAELANGQVVLIKRSEAAARGLRIFGEDAEFAGEEASIAALKALELGGSIEDLGPSAEAAGERITSVLVALRDQISKTRAEFGRLGDSIDELER